MNRSRIRQMLRALASLMTALALLLGVPGLLVTAAGWPLPTRLPNLEALDQAVRTGISDVVVVNTLAVIGWISWLQLALALIVEAVAVIRGRQAIRLPVFPGLQVVAARLVGGIVLITSNFQTTVAYAAPPPIPAALSVTTTDVAPDLSIDALDPWSLQPSVPEPADEPLSTEDPQPTVTVQRHDSYWAIAERILGDGLRWREIYDLNVGRTLPNGETITAGDGDLRAGWVLVLPADAIAGTATVSGPDLGEVPDSGVQTVTLVVEEGDNLWKIAEEHLETVLARHPTDAEIAPYWLDVIETNEDRYVEPGNPNLIHPGQVLTLPPAGEDNAPAAPASDSSPPAERPSGPALPDHSPAPRNEDTADELPAPATPAHQNGGTARPGTDMTEPALVDPSSNVRDDLVIPVAVGGLSSVALAVGLKRLLDRRRRQFANTHPGQVPGRTQAEQCDLHQALIAQADEERIDDLQGVLGRLAATLATQSSSRRPRMIRHSEHSLEVLLDQPDTEAPDGWTANEDGTVWTLTVIPDPDDLYEGPLCPTPLMVTVGEPDDDAQLYLDLEAEGLLALTGEPDAAKNLARSIVTELTLSPLADMLRVVAVGDIVDHEAEIFEHLTVLDSWDRIAEDVLTWADQSHQVLAEKGWANAFIGRGHEPDHDGLVPVAVIADRPPPPEVVASLWTTLPSAVAVVVVGAFDGALATIRAEAGVLNFDTADLACNAQAVTADELADMCQLLVATDDPDERELLGGLREQHEANVSLDGHEPDPLLEDPDARDVDGQGPEPAPEGPPEYQVLVRLLGDITVEGGRPLKPKPTAVVAYLALYRSVTTERLEEACWFGSDGTAHRKRLRDVMSESREALGSHHFPANRNGCYLAGPGVRTDIDLFNWYVENAADADPCDAVSHYRAALDLVSGKPFSYPNAARASYGWVDFEHHATTWEHRVADVAQACAELYLDLGEADEASTMLRRLVQAVPLNSAIVEALMCAHIANEDSAGAEKVYQEHAKALEQAQLGDPDDSIEQLRLDLRGG